jgi:hypothetical protein
MRPRGDVVDAPRFDDLDGLFQVHEQWLAARRAEISIQRGS